MKPTFSIAMLSPSVILRVRLQSPPSARNVARLAADSSAIIHVTGRRTQGPVALKWWPASQANHVGIAEWSFHGWSRSEVIEVAQRLAKA